MIYLVIKSNMDYDFTIEDILEIFKDDFIQDNRTELR